MLNRVFVVGLILIVVGGGGAILLDAIDEPFDDVFALLAGIGFALALYARACTHFQKVNRPADEAFDSGYELGHEKGWREGRDADRPKIIPIRRRRSRE